MDTYVVSMESGKWNTTNKLLKLAVNLKKKKQLPLQEWINVSFPRGEKRKKTRKYSMVAANISFSSILKIGMNKSEFVEMRKTGITSIKHDAYTLFVCFLC